MNKASVKTTTATKTAVKTKVAKTPKVQPEPVREPEPVVEQKPIEQTVDEVQVEETTVDSMKSRFEKMIKSKQELITQLKQEIGELRKMQRDHELALKDASKRSKKKRVRDDTNPRKPSGFASPVVVSDELYDFLGQYGVKKGDPIARTDVTRYISTYIKEHNLQNPEARREILPDATLQKLFGPATEHRDPNDPTSPKVFTYFGPLQRYLSHHFPKKQV